MDSLPDVRTSLIDPFGRHVSDLHADRGAELNRTALIVARPLALLWGTHISPIVHLQTRDYSDT